MSTKKNDTDFKSEDLQEILGKIPSGITRFGSLFILLALLSIVAASAVIKFPSIIKAPLEISAPAPSMPIYIETNVQVEKIFVKENQEVKKGELLVLLVSDVNENQVFILEGKIDSLRLYPDLVDQISFPILKDLGELQKSYKVFLNNLKVERKTHLSATKVNTDAQFKLAELKSKNVILRKKSNAWSAELQVLNQNYFTDLDLLKKGAISPREVDHSMDALNAKQLACKKLNVEISDLKILIKDLKAKIAAEQTSANDEVIVNQIDYNEISEDLKSNIVSWKNNYLIYAPCAGIVSLNQDYSEDSVGLVGQVLLNIVQKSSALKLVIAKVSPKDISKVKIGQKVQIKLESSELILGEVASVSSEIKGDYYPITIDLPTPLKRSNGTEIIIDSETNGSAEIENDKISYLSNIINKLKLLISKKQ